MNDCSGGIVFIMYLGFYGPEISVYIGHPMAITIHAYHRRLWTTMRKFSSSIRTQRLTSVMPSTSPVTERVVIYSQANHDPPLTAIPFADIVDVELYRNESFFEDSEITLYFEDDQVFSVPVSSEFDRDQQCFTPSAIARCSKSRVMDGSLLANTALAMGTS